MDESRPVTDDPAADLKRRALLRRAKRGLVASYIHGLSERHGRDALTRADPAAAAPPPAEA